MTRVNITQGNSNTEVIEFEHNAQRAEFLVEDMDEDGGGGSDDLLNSCNPWPFLTYEDEASNELVVA